MTGTMIVPSCVHEGSPTARRPEAIRAVTPYVDHSSACQCVDDARRDRRNEPGRAGIVDDV